MKFIEFTQSREYQLGMAAVGQMTVVQEFGQEDEIDQFYAVFAEQLETARARLAIPGASQVDGILQDALTPAFEGQVTVQEALSNAAAQIDPLMAAEQ